MGEVTGGIVIKQLKNYAGRLTDSTGSSAMVQLDVWCHKYKDSKEFNVYMKAFTCAENKSIKPRFETDDLRELGNAIEDYINGNNMKKRGTKNG